MSISKIYCGDCLEHLKKIPKETVDLTYIDPPFHSGKNYDTIWDNGYEQAHFDDTWYSDGQRTGMERYILWLRRRVEACHDVLKPTGSLYLHCDWHANHHIRLMLDQVFGEKNFRNEIVWCYKTTLRVSKKSFGKDHENIYFYSKSDEHKICPDRNDFPSSESTLKRWGKYADKNGFVSNEYFSDSSNISIPIKTKKGGGFNINFGIPRDWWEISSNVAKGNTDEVKFGKYTTQKPLSLLQRIIKASSKEGDVVLDPMCGGGTTIVKAQMLGRKWIGMDISPTACRMMIKRLNDVGVKIVERDVINYPLTREELKSLTSLEFENWVKGRMRARKPEGLDEGIDAITSEGANFLPREIKRVGIQIKQQYKVGRSIVQKLRGDIDEHKMEYDITDKYGIIVGFSFTRDAINHCAKFLLKYNIDIKLVTVDELMNYKLMRGVDRWMK